MAEPTEWGALQFEYGHVRAELDGAARNQVAILGVGGLAVSTIIGGGIFQFSLLLLAAPVVAYFFFVLWTLEATRLSRASEYLGIMEARMNRLVAGGQAVGWHSWVAWNRGDERDDDGLYRLHDWAHGRLRAFFLGGIFVSAVVSGVFAYLAGWRGVAVSSTQLSPTVEGLLLGLAAIIGAILFVSGLAASKSSARPPNPASARERYDSFNSRKTR